MNIRFRCIALFFLCECIAFTAHAKWELITSSTSGATIYYDPDRVQRDPIRSNIVYSWELTNLKVPLKRDGKSVYSTISKMAYDCTAEKSDLMVTAQYSEKFGSGQVVISRDFSSLGSEFQSLIPNSIGEASMRVVCKK